MLKRLLQLALLMTTPVYAQVTFTYPALSTPNVWTNSNTFTAPVIFNSSGMASCGVLTTVAGVLTCGGYTPAPTFTLTTTGTSGAASYSGNVINVPQYQAALGFTPAHGGANSDITSLSGLTTALSTGQGGTGATTAAGALANLGGAALSGATFTGPISGTSASFSGTVAAGTATPTTIGSNGVLLNGVPALKSQTSLNNYYSGGAGNLTGTGIDNTADGLYALYFNTTGSSNTANGWAALYFNTTGSNNTANGYQALYSTTTGNNNTANGYQALYSTTTGNNNTANGFEALFSNTTGSSNTANGWAAGQYIADGVTANHTSSNSVYEGFQAYPLANGDTNENVIGNTAIGHGSNTTTLGNSSITDTYLAGTVHSTSFTGNAATATTAAALSGTLPAANGGTGEAGTITGVLYGNGTSAATAATAAQIVAVISTTPVANATAATTAAALSVPLAHAIIFPDPNAGAVYTASQVLGTFYAPNAGTVPASGTGTYNSVTATSVCKLATAATASTTFTFADNGVSFGTVVFAISGTTGTFTISSAKAISSGDKITLTGPATADATAAGLNCSLVFAY